jgi:hypothetical protein
MKFHRVAEAKQTQGSGLDGEKGMQGKGGKETT